MDEYPICAGCELGMEDEEVVALQLHDRQPLCWSCTELGRGEPRPYVLRVTHAPESYDGFGTVTVSTYRSAKGREFRCVQINVDALTWQTDRYHSGMYPITTVEQFHERVSAELIS